MVLARSRDSFSTYAAVGKLTKTKGRPSRIIVEITVYLFFWHQGRTDVDVTLYLNSTSECNAIKE